MQFDYSELNLKGAKGVESVQSWVVLIQYCGPGRQNSGSETVHYYNTLDAGLLCCKHVTYDASDLAIDRDFE